ncbi:MAG: hypothetical protein MRERC_3c145 [Mycoplasmataceae bacterium RC_NB112A]|nr:MAG: hypothetical protein MRERC_3c145 [Mycoplasmataceae bacterium RC_NB112A]
MECNACGTKNNNAWVSFNGIWGLEREILSKFISQKSGRNLRGFFDFELCGECNKEYEKFFSQKLKEKMITELASKIWLIVFFLAHTDARNILRIMTD